MKLKTAITAISLGLLFTGCTKEDNTHQTPDTSRYVNNYNFIMTGAQNVPASSSAASGAIQGTYDKKTKTYTYVLSWTGLSGNPLAIHIHGIADAGYIALPIPLGPYTNGIAQNITGF